jgi:hypothetical protein
MPAHKMARAERQQQSWASGAAFGEYIAEQRDCRAFVCLRNTGESSMINAIKWGLLAFVLFASAYAVETRAILDLESSGPQVNEYAP